MQIRYPLFFYLFYTESIISARTSNCVLILFMSRKPHLSVILLHMKRTIMRSLSVIALILWVSSFHFPLIFATSAEILFAVISYPSLYTGTSVDGTWKRLSICLQGCTRIRWLWKTRLLICYIFKRKPKGKFDLLYWT